MLTSESAKNKGVVDPKVQATIEDLKGKGLLEEVEEPRDSRQSIMTQMLLSKYQRQQRKVREDEEWARRNASHWRGPFFKYC